MTNRHPLIGALCLALLSGCGSNQPGDVMDYVKALRQSWRNTFNGNSVSLQQAAAVPYASMGWRLNGSSENMIVLATDAGGQQLWTSAAHIVLVTQGGRLVRTVGLPHDIAALTPKTASAILDPAVAIAGPYSQRFAADYQHKDLYGVVLNCRAAAAGARLMTILGKKIATVRVDETCESTAPQMKFTNSYWISRDTGLVWRSRQTISPEGDVLETELLRPPG